ncbi:MAG TPA: DUF4382 domain-containing protein [Holophaga sp.]|nr:DUF4382 domain-containing protein [Holophaga sp.]
MNRSHLLLAGAGLGMLALTLACGGGSSSLAQPKVAYGNVDFQVTDATTEDWSNVGVIIRKASLVLASDTKAASPVTIYDGSADTTPINLLQADQVNDLLSRAKGVPAGTYDRLIVEVDGDPAHITLVPAPDAAGVTPAAIPSSQIIVRGASSTAHPTWKVLPTIKLDTPIVVSDGQTTAVAVDFDLAHPVFIVEHDTLTSSLPVYVVNFGTPNIVRHKHAPAITHYYLRRHLGTVASVAADGSSMTMTTEHGQTFTVHADKGANPTLFYNLDVRPVTAVPANAFPATVTAGLGVEVTARYQADGTLTAVRVWYTATAANLPKWTPEGHITRVDRVNNIIRVLDSAGDPKPIAVNADTKWYWRGDTSTELSGGNGAAFLANVERFFKVQVTVADPLATPMVATSIDIQRGVFEGTITNATATSFTYQKGVADMANPIAHTLAYGTSFSFWNFTFPGMASTSIPDFLLEANSGIVLDSSGTTFKPYAASSLSWAAGGWAANNAIFMPIALSPYAQTVTTAFASGSMQVTPRAGTIGMGGMGTRTGSTTATGTPVPVTVNLSSTAQEQPLVTLINRQAGTVVTITSLDATQWANYLTAGAKVRVFGVPDGSGHLKAYYVNIYQ